METLSSEFISNNFIKDLQKLDMPECVRVIHIIDHENKITGTVAVGEENTQIIGSEETAALAESMVVLAAESYLLVSSEGKTQISVTRLRALFDNIITVVEESISTRRNTH